MHIKLISYWLISIITLACCLFMSWEDSNLATSPPLNLTKILQVEPKFFYYNNDKYHAKISGELQLNIKPESLNADYLHYNAVVIKDLNIDLSSVISLNWQVGEQSFNVPLKNSRNSITPFRFDVSTVDQISNLHILIKPIYELGSQSYLGREVTFKSIFFDTIEQHNTIAKLLSGWLNFNPIKFNSINGYSDVDQLNHKGLILRLTIWVLISIVLYQILSVSGALLITNLAVAWLLLFSIFGVNFYKQHQQIQQVYPNKTTFINIQDNQAYNLAQLIKENLKNHPSWNQDGQKFIILGLQDFFYLRLFYHLLDLNIALSSNTQSLHNDNLGSDFIFILANMDLSLCNNPTYFEFIKTGFETLKLDQNACLVRNK